jgi:hypothetical protein
LICLRTWCAAAGLATAGSASALGPAAPFTPPAPAAAAASAAGADAAAAVSTDAIAGLRLGPAPQALIDGQWLRLGDRVRGARLVAIDARGARIEYPDGRRQALPLSPAAQWTLPAPAPAPRTR